MSLDKIVAMLPSLTQRDLRKVVALASSLLKTSAPPDTEVAEFYQIAFNEAKDLGIKFQHYAEFSKTSHHPALVTKYQFIREFANESVDNLSKTERRTLYRIFIRSLYSWLVEVGAPISAISMVNNLEKMPGIIDNAFPGYMQAGLLGALVRMKDRGAQLEDGDV